MSVNGRSFTRSNFTVVLFYDCLVPVPPESASLVALYVLLPLFLGAAASERRVDTPIAIHVCSRILSR